jgi:putative aldouronate transport system substrate-binding protein
MEGVADGYLSYPRSNVKSVQRVPGRGGDVSVVTVNLGRPLQPLEQNPAWQEINRQLGVNLKVLAVPFADYSNRVNTLIAGDELPDILYAGSATIPNLAEFFKAKCQDLTPYVSGDAIKDYPNLANLPTRAWKGMVYNGAIYAVPNAINGVVTYGMYVHQPLLDEIGAQYPTNADEFKRLMQELTRPQAGVWGQTADAGTGLNVTNGLYTSMFGAPNNWRVEPSGAFTRSFETEEYKAATAYNRDLYAAGIYSPDSPTNNVVSSRLEFAARKAATRWEGWNGTGTILLWDSARNLTPPSVIRHPGPIAAQAGSKPIYFLGRGSGGPIVLKKAPEARIRELLGILDFFATPFGTQEHLLLRYGIKDADYTLDDSGNPILTERGQTNSTPVWQYIGSAQQVLYYPRDPQFAPVSQAAEQAMVSVGVDDPTVGLYSASDGSRGAAINRAFFDGISELVIGRRPLADFDTLVREWRSGGGDEIRTQYQQSLQSARA